MMPMKELPQDIVIEILKRLPVKSLIRFKMIHRKCQELIESRSFIDDHLSHSVGGCLVVLDRNLQTLDSCNESCHSISCLSYGTYDHAIQYNSFIPCCYSNYKLVGCCRGIMCLAKTDLGCHNNVLLNPATKRLKILPDIDCMWADWGFYPPRIGLGFGFDPDTEDYKMVRICESWEGFKRRRQCSDAFLYSLKNEQWSKIENIMDGVVVYDDSISKALVHNNLHWRAVLEKGGRRLGFIAAFDIVRELYRKICLPPVPQETMKQSTLSELKASLSMFVCHYSDEENLYSLDLWVMEEYGVAESWSKQLTVRPYYQIERLVGLVNSDVLFYQKEYKLVACDVKSQELKTCSHFSKDLTLKVENYRESLVKLKGEKSVGVGERNGKESYPSMASFAFLFCLIGYLNFFFSSNRRMIHIDC